MKSATQSKYGICSNGRKSRKDLAIVNYYKILIQRIIKYQIKIMQNPKHHAACTDTGTENWPTFI